ncbi:MAG: hypothetical protein ACPGJV_10135 [Bacteriovoracaceae bacterium]
MIKVISLLILTSCMQLDPYDSFDKEVIRESLIRSSKLPRSEKYDSGYVIQPYDEFKDRDGVDFSELRNLFEHGNTSDGSVVIVLTKNKKVVGFVRILRGKETDTLKNPLQSIE